MAYDCDSLASEGIPARQLFDVEDGEDALAKGRRVLETVRAAMAKYRPEE